MRLRAVSRIVQSQDVCLFCAFRSSLETTSRRRPFLSQSRSYRRTGPAFQAAQAAALEEKDEEGDAYIPPMLRQSAASQSRYPFPERKETPPTPVPKPSPYESQPDWRCRCGHVNLATKTSCTSCYEPRHRHAQLFNPDQLRRSSREPPSAGGIGERSFGRFGRGIAERDSYDPTRRGDDGATRPRGGARNFERRPFTPRRDDSRTAYNYSSDEPKSRFGALVDNAMSSNGRRQPDNGVPPNRFGSFTRRTDSERSGYASTRATSPRSLPRGAGFFGIQEPEKTPLGRPGSQFSRQPGADPSQRTSGTNFRSIDLPAKPESEVLPSASNLEFSAFSEGTRRDRAKVDRRGARFDIRDEDIYEDASKVQKKNSKPSRQTSARSDKHEADNDPDELINGRTKRRSKKAKSGPISSPSKPSVHLPEFVSVERLAQLLKLRVETLVAKLEEEGYEGARYDNILDLETSAMFADLYGFEAIPETFSSAEDLAARPPAEDKSLLPPRPPIVTIMGHVDHGKTTILDWLRKSSVVESEHGGITQHIGAFSFMMPGSERQITFLDTPGHAAFLDMRRRGANVTDIVVLVVAADDSVKPQTIEAIKHALDAKVQIIVAINKIDKADADIDRVKQDLNVNDITVEDYGGDYQAIAVSGKTGQGMADLEEAILTLADVSDFRAETDGPAEGWVIESKVTVAGRVATVLVRRGTLRPGDIIVAGTTWSRVRTLRNDAGNLVEEAPPGTPVQVDGWRGDPTAGLEVLQAENEDHAKEVVDLRVERLESVQAAADMVAINAARNEEAEARAYTLEKEAEQRRNFVPSLHGKRHYKQALDNEGWVEDGESSGPQKVHFVVKADVAGSVEALVAAVSAVGNNEIIANVIHSGPGLLTESDIRRLAATGEKGYAISFNQTIESSVAQLAHGAGLQILDHNIIYKVTDDVKAKLSDALPPLKTQKVLGEAEIGQIFEISTKKGKLKIAGCKVTNGTMDRSHKIRVLRSGRTVYTGTLESLKNVKKDVNEMRKGTECGLGFDNWSDFEVGDQIQNFEEKEEKRTLY